MQSKELEMSKYDLKMARAFGDFTGWTYTGNCDAKGGYCECGKQIVYRYFVSRGSETKIVGSTCIDHFKGNSALYEALREADKVNQKNHKERQGNLKVVNQYLDFVSKGLWKDTRYESECKKYIDNPNQIRLLSYDWIKSVMRKTERQLIVEKWLIENGFKEESIYFVKNGIKVLPKNYSTTVNDIDVLENEIGYIKAIDK